MVSVPFTKDHVFSGGSKVPDLRAMIGAGAYVPKWSDEAPRSDLQETALSGLFSIRSKAGGRRVSSSLGRGVVELDFPLLQSYLVSAALGAGLSNSPDAKSVDLQIFAPKSSDPFRPEFVDRPVSPGHG